MDEPDQDLLPPGSLSLSFSRSLTPSTWHKVLLNCWLGSLTNLFVPPRSEIGEIALLSSSPDCLAVIFAIRRRVCRLSERTTHKQLIWVRAQKSNRPLQLHSRLRQLKRGGGTWSVARRCRISSINEDTNAAWKIWIKSLDSFVWWEAAISAEVCFVKMYVNVYNLQPKWKH